MSNYEDAVDRLDDYEKLISNMVGLVQAHAKKHGLKLDADTEQYISDVVTEGLFNDDYYDTKNTVEDGGDGFDPVKEWGTLHIGAGGSL